MEIKLGERALPELGSALPAGYLERELDPEEHWRFCWRNWLGLDPALGGLLAYREGCWEWLGLRDQKGYGMYALRGPNTWEQLGQELRKVWGIPAEAEERVEEEFMALMDGLAYKPAQLRTYLKNFSLEVFKAHRYVWTLIAGRNPVDRILKNQCGRRGCCNPMHHKLLSRSESARFAASSRWGKPSGEES